VAEGRKEDRWRISQIHLHQTKGLTSAAQAKNRFVRFVTPFCSTIFPQSPPSKSRPVAVGFVTVRRALKGRPAKGKGSANIARVRSLGDKGPAQADRREERGPVAFRL